MGMKEWMETLARERAASNAMGGQEAVERQHSRGRLSVRERLARLLDAGSFMELGMLARAQDPALDDVSAADGLVTGFGKINGMGTAVVAEDATVLDNTDAQVAAMKRARLLDLTARTGWQVVFLADRGEGRVRAVKQAFLLGGAARQDPGPNVSAWPSLTLAAVMGNCFGAAANTAVAADFLVMVKGSCLQIEGPVQAQDNSTLHAQVTGVVDRVAADDDEALALLRQLTSYLPPNTGLPPPRRLSGDSAERELGAAASLVPEELEQSYDVTPLVQMLVDKGSFFALKPDFGPSLVTGLARLDGHSIGVVASQPLHNGGVLDGAALRKALRLARLCRRFRLPLLFLQDTPGYAASSPGDQRDLLTATSELVQTITELSAPKLVVVLRRGHVLGDFVLGGRRLGIDYVAAWPFAEIPTTEPAGFAATPAPPRGTRGGPWPAADLGIIEEVLEPSETRARLSHFLEIALLHRSLPDLSPDRDSVL